MYVRIGFYILLFILIIIIILYTHVDSNEKIFNKEIWPVKKEERFDKLIVYEITDEYKDRTLFDPYTVTHISHGILLYYIMNHINPKQYEMNLYYSIGIEILWEIWENTDFFINVYRNYNKYSEFYMGDSIINILTDISMMIIGFLFASKYKRAFLFVIISEIILYCKYKDNLLKNIKDIIISPLIKK
tara:strand:+ start:73 stop:636 length:564 start_codon:yes stop_codon:yes gene_type:complete